MLQNTPEWYRDLRITVLDALLFAKHTHSPLQAAKAYGSIYRAIDAALLDMSLCRQMLRVLKENKVDDSKLTEPDFVSEIIWKDIFCTARKLQDESSTFSVYCDSRVFYGYRFESR